MENAVNGITAPALSSQLPPQELPINGVHENTITIEQLEQELPVVYDGQVPLGDLVSRVVQSIYAELSELAETMPNVSDSARKRTLADWVVKTKKQVVKLYGIAKWSRDADVVQKAMNITAFLMNQNRQFDEAIFGLSYAKDSLDPARLRNHDLLTSLDVLTTGSYRRLPSGIKKIIIPPAPLTDQQVNNTLIEMEHAVRFRLRVDDIIPVEMLNYRIADGRVFFTAPKLFEASLFLGGSQSLDGWFFANVQFLFTVGGDLTGTQEFPRQPTGLLNRHITEEANARLRYYLPHPPGVELPPDTPPKPQLPPDVVDAPLVRVFNFLQFMSLSYQLEILWYQAERMRSLGWADYLKVTMASTRKTFQVSYWLRQPLPTGPGRPQPRIKLPPHGGTVTVSIVEARQRSRIGSNPLGGVIGGPARSPKARILAEIQERSKLGAVKKPSDDVEGLKIEVKWEPMKGALNVSLSPTEAKLPSDFLKINPDDLDFEGLLRRVLDHHAHAILQSFQMQLQRSPMRSSLPSSTPGEVILVRECNESALRVHLCADEVVIITIDPRTGKLNMRDTGDLAAAGRGPRFFAISERLNENPGILFEALVRLRLSTITELAEHKANYLGLQCYRNRNFSREEIQKLGPTAKGTLYIQLSTFPDHYLVLVITDDDFRYALISAQVLPDSMYANMIMGDIAWLDVRRIRGDSDLLISERLEDEFDVFTGSKRKRPIGDDAGRDMMKLNESFKLETRLIRELYAYCCARVAYTKVEQQLKLRGIPFTHVNPGATGFPSHVQSSLARSIPALCVQSSDILSGAPAAEAAMPNIRVIPLNWWSEKKAQVITCVKLKYVQQPMGKSAGTGKVIRPSKRIIYDTTEAVVCFLSENVNTCVDEFLEEWARVSKVVVIAREVAQMAKVRNWEDVRLLSFDLQTAEFAYAGPYTVSITCTDQLSPTGGSYDLRFSRCDGYGGDNPHADAEPFLRNILRNGRLTICLNRVVELLRNTLPIVVLLEEVRAEALFSGENVASFAKAAGWYRLMYGDFKYALDFRLMTGQRVAILDASHSIFPPDPTLTRGKAKVQNTQECGFLLQSIPGLKEILVDVLKEDVGSFVWSVDVGIMCSVNAVKRVGKALHQRVLSKVKESGGR